MASSPRKSSPLKSAGAKRPSAAKAVAQKVLAEESAFHPMAGATVTTTTTVVQESFDGPPQSQAASATFGAPVQIKKTVVVERPMTSPGKGAEMFRNEAYEAKIAEVQAQFQAELQRDPRASPTRVRKGDDGLAMDEFYKIMGEFYQGQKRHDSPTKRLMQQKKASFDHKTKLYQKIKSGEIDPQKYSITYVTDPNATYMIQPKDGEINYDRAMKNPNKFYDDVMNQDVLEHKVAMRTKTVTVTQGGDESLPAVRKKTKNLEVRSRTTKRAVARILLAIQDKLQRMVSDVTNNEHDPSLVREALEHPQTKSIVQRNIAANKIGLVDNRQSKVYTAQMQLIGEKGDRAVNESPGGQDDAEQVEPEEARLEAEPAAITEVTESVNQLIRTKSLKSQAERAAEAV